MPPKKTKKTQATKAVAKPAEGPAVVAVRLLAKTATPKRGGARSVSAAEALPHRQDLEDCDAAATPRLERYPLPQPPPSSRPDPIQLLLPAARGSVAGAAGSGRLAGHDSPTSCDMFRSAVGSFAEAEDEEMASPAVIPPQLAPASCSGAGGLAAVGAVTPRLQRRGAPVGGGPGYASSCARQRGRSGMEAAPSEPAPALTSANMTELWTLASERRRRAAMQAIARVGSLDRLLQTRMDEAAAIAAELRRAMAATAAGSGGTRPSGRRGHREQLESVRHLRSRLADCRVSCVQLSAEKKQLAANVAAHLSAAYRRVGRYR